MTVTTNGPNFLSDILSPKIQRKTDRNLWLVLIQGQSKSFHGHPDLVNPSVECKIYNRWPHLYKRIWFESHICVNIIFNSELMCKEWSCIHNINVKFKKDNYGKTQYLFWNNNALIDFVFQSNLLYIFSINEAPDLVFQTWGRTNSPTVDPSLPLPFSLHHDHNTLGILQKRRQSELCCYSLKSSILEWAGHGYYQWDNTKKPSPLTGDLPRLDRE